MGELLRVHIQNSGVLVDLVYHGCWWPYLHVKVWHFAESCPSGSVDIRTICGAPGIKKVALCKLPICIA